jgi:hypothetical protein
MKIDKNVLRLLFIKNYLNNEKDHKTSSGY